MCRINLSVNYPYLDSLLTEIKYKFSTKNSKILNLKNNMPKYRNNIDVSKTFDTTLLFSFKLSGTLN